MLNEIKQRLLYPEIIVVTLFPPKLTFKIIYELI